MPSPIYSTTHSPDALAKLAMQYQGKPRLAALASVFLAQLQAIEDALLSPATGVIPQRQLANSVGVQLDKIGSLVGQPRNGQVDAVYLLYIRARIALNFSSGTVEEIQRVFSQALPGASLVLTEQFPAGLDLRIASVLPANTTDLNTILKAAKAAGVRSTLQWQTAADASAFTLEPLFTTCLSTAGGASQLGVASVAGFPYSGTIIIDAGTSIQETVAYTSLQTIGTPAFNLATPLVNAHLGAGVQLQGSAGLGLEAAGIAKFEAAYTAGTTFFHSGPIVNLLGPGASLAANAIASGPWGPANGGLGVAPTRTNNFGTAPEGSATAGRVQLSLGGGTTVNDYSGIQLPLPYPGSGLVVGTAYDFTVWLKTNDGTTQTLLLRGPLNVNGTLITVTGTWSRFVITQTADTSTTGVWIWLRGATGCSNAVDLLTWDPILGQSLGFPASGTLVLAKGTAVEETVTYATFAASNGFSGVSPTAFFHSVNDTIQLASPPGGLMSGALASS